MTVDSPEELAKLQRIGQIVGLTLKTMAQAVRPGITTAELDALGLRTLQAHGARSAPRLVYQFPGATCISVNEEAAHGIPGPRVIRAGDLVNIDVSAELDGYFADTGASVAVPPVAEPTQKLCDAVYTALWRVIDTLRAGMPLNTVGRIVEEEARRSGLRPIRMLTGHGVGRGLHEEPEAIHNFFKPNDKRIFHEGQVVAIEPFMTLGSGNIVEEPDGWTLRTVDRRLPAQFEHTLVIQSGPALVITAV